MFRDIRFFLKDAIVKYSVLSAMLFIVAQLAVLIIKIRPSDKGIFLHYTSYLGVDLVGAWSSMYFVPLANLLTLTLNSALAYRISRKDKVLGYLLALGSALLSLLLLIYVILIARLNA